MVKYFGTAVTQSGFWLLPVICAEVPQIFLDFIDPAVKFSQVPTYYLYLSLIKYNIKREMTQSSL